MAPKTADQVFNELQGNEDFQFLSYQDQVKVRASLVSQALQKDTNFMSMNSASKQKVMDYYLFQPPAMTAEEREKFKGDGLMLKAITQERAAGNKDAGTDLFKSWSLTNSIYDSSVVMKLAAHGMMNIADLPSTFKALGSGGDTPGTVYSNYMNKRGTYAQMMLDKEGKNDLFFSAVKFAAPMAIFLGEVSGMYKLLGASSIGKATGLTKTLLSGVEKAKYIWPRMAYLGARSGIHSLVGGGIGVMYETVKDTLNGAWNDPDYNFLLSKAQDFGEYFLGDFAVFAAGGLFNTLRGAGKYSFGKSFRDMAKPLAQADDVKKALTQVLTNTVDPGFFKTLPETTQEILRRSEATVKTIKNVAKSSDADKVIAVMQSRGFSAALEGANYVVRSMDLDKVITKKKNVHELLDWFIEQTEAVPKMGKPDVAAAGAYFGDVKLRQQITSNLALDNPQAADNLVKIIAPYKGVFKKQNINTFSKGYLRYAGASDDVVRSLKVIDADDVYKVVVKDKTVLDIPKTIKTSEKGIVDSLVTKLDELTSGKALNPEAGKNFISLYDDVIKKQNLYTPSWIHQKLQEMGMELGRDFTIKLPDGATQSFQSYDEIGDYVLANSISLQEYASYVRDSFGLITEKKGEKYITRYGRKVVAEGESVADLIKNNPDYKIQIPSTLGPEFTIVDGNVQKVVYDGNIVVGSYQQILGELGNFRNYNDKLDVKIPAKDGAISFSNYSKQFEVSIPGLNYTERFSSLKKAKKFLTKGQDEFDMLKYVAGNKGYRIDNLKGNWVMYADDGRMLTAASMEEVVQIMDNTPATTYAPELTGLDQQVIANIDTRIEGFQHKPFSYHLKYGNPDLSSGLKISSLTRNPPGYINQAMKMGAPMEFAQNFNNVMGVKKLTNSLHNQIDEVVRGGLTDAKGKFFKNKDMEKIGELIWNKPEDWGKITKSWKKTKNIADIEEGARKARAIFGENPEVVSLFSYLGVDPYKFLNDYAPAIRKHLETAKGLKYVDSDTGKLLNDVFQGTADPKLKAFFEYSRVSNIAALVREKNAYTLISKYLSAGLNTRYMAPIAKESNAVIKKLLKAKKLDSVSAGVYFTYMNEISGIPYGFTANIEKQLTKSVNKRLGKNFMPNSIIEKITGSAYLASMGWRIWLPIRNAFQIWTMLAPRIGNTWVARAAKAVKKDIDGLLFKEAMNAGVLSKTNYMPLASAEMFNPGSKLPKILKSGLKWYKNSDDFTRVVAYQAGKARFEDALNRFVVHKNSEKFFKQAGGWFMDIPERNKLISLLSEGNTAAAKDLFGRTIANETMFVYEKGMTPMSFKGTIGKIFGQMGMYSTWYAENIRRGLRNGTTAQKFAFGARFAANSAAIWGAFQLAGINAKNFAAWDPVMFTGGPYWDVLNDMLNLFDSGMEGATSRYQLAGITMKDGLPYVDLKTFSKSSIVNLIVPGSLAMRGLEKGWEHWNNGDYYKAFLAFGTFPIKPE